jgi:hypothetical protein
LATSVSFAVHGSEEVKRVLKLPVEDYVLKASLLLGF